MNRKNVYELIQERLDVIFSEFDNIYISFSGGKDSGVLLNLCIDYIRRNHLKRRIGVFHMDYEIQYSMTIDYVNRVFATNKDILDFYRVCVPFRVPTCTSMFQNYWRPWDETKRKIWVREMPKDAMTIDDFLFITTKCGITTSKPNFHVGCTSKRLLNVLAVWWEYVLKKVTTVGELFIDRPKKGIKNTNGVRK